MTERKDIPLAYRWRLEDIYESVEDWENALRAAEKLAADGGALLVMDEAMAAYNHGLIDRERLLGFLREKPESLEVVMTGRDPAAELLELADYVSEIRKVKHPFDRGITARKGIEY